MGNYVYCVVETNGYSCGCDATEFVSFQRRLSKMEADLFRNIIKDVRKVQHGKGKTTAITSEALNRFAKETAIIGKLCHMPYEGSFYF